MLKTNLYFRFTWLTLLALVVSSLPWQVEAHVLQAPGPFGKYLPIDSGIDQNVWTLTLDWNASTEASGYEFCFDKTNDNLCDSSWTSAGTDTSAEITYLEAYTTYFWQVRAVNGAETTEADGGTWWGFTTAAYTRFHVQLLENHIVGFDWLPGTAVTVTVDDPSNGPGIDFTDIKTADAYGTVLFYNLGSLVLEPGMHVTMAGGGTLKSHTVMDLKVSQVDIDTDTVSGTGNLVGANLNIQHCQVEGCLWRRWATVQADGTWKADFSTAGPGGDETEILDMVPGTPGVAMWPDEDADHTEVNWYPAKRFAAYPDEERVDGTGWPWGKTITMTINDPGTPANPDYSDTTIVAAHPGNITQEWFNIDFHTQYDLKAGDIVTVTDGTTVKVHTVTGLKITDANPNANAVSGTAEAGSYVDIATCGVEGCVFRTELADLDGNWSANFGLIGDQPWEQALSDILPNTNGSANQWDADADSTNIGWLALCKLFLPLIRR